MELWTFLISMMPVGELRFSIPFGMISGLHWFDAFSFSLIGNSLITLILVYLFKYFSLDIIVDFFSKIPIIGLIFKKWYDKALNKSVKFKNWTYLGLALFVSIPLPITGAWTAVLISSLLKLKPLKSYIFITFGLIISGSIITFICYNFSNFLNYIFINDQQIKDFIKTIS